MKMRFLAVIICVLVAFTGCGAKTEYGKPVVEMAVYRLGDMSASYYFIVNTDDEFIVVNGERSADNAFVIEKSDEEAKKKLSDGALKWIKNAAKEIFEEKTENDDLTVQDGWVVQLSYKGDCLSQYYDSCDNAVKALADEMISVSPMKVDLK